MKMHVLKLNRIIMLFIHIVTCTCMKMHVRMYTYGCIIIIISACLYSSDLFVFSIFMYMLCMNIDMIILQGIKKQIDAYDSHNLVDVEI